MKYNVNRRDFIKNLGIASVGMGTAQNVITQLNTMLSSINNLHSIQTDDYKALVCVYLNGGADSFNMIVPTDDEAFNQYKITRSNLALEKNTLLDISPLNSNQKLGLHPSMGNIKRIFDDGNLCFINNIGTLIRPVTKVEVYNESVPLPLGLFSHSDQTSQWHTAVSSSREINGWAGRVTEKMYAANTNQNISMNISLSGVNTFQSSSISTIYTINNNGAVNLNRYDNEYYYANSKNAIDKLLAHQYGDPFKDTYKLKMRNSIDANIEFQSAIEKVPPFQTQFTDENLSQTFKMIAQVISARKDLGFKRQIFFVDFGNWDNHDELLNNQSANLNILDNALGEFYNVLQEINALDKVVTFSMSEFGRTLTSNGNGTDHAWGGNVFSFGGAVMGQRCFGVYPDLTLDNDLDLGTGILIPTTPTDLYFAELSSWLGIDHGDLTDIFPNLSAFYTPGSAPPLGFLRT